MEFSITISSGTIKYNLQVERTALGAGFERFKVHPKDSSDKFIVIQNNRPLIRNKYKLKTKPLTWVVKEGEVKNEKYYQQLLKRIEEFLEPKPEKKKSIGYFEQRSTPSNRKQKPKGGTTLGDRKA